MPRLKRLVSDRYSSYKSSRRSTSKDGKYGKSSDTHEASSHEEAVAGLKAPYEQLEEQESVKTGDSKDHASDRIRKTVSFELTTTRDRFEREGCAASMV